jgi:nucleoside-diphosphate-sugar epimerase
VVNLLTAKAVVDGVITVRGGDQWRPFLHVQDAAHAVSMALEAPIDVVRNQTFNVGSEGQNYTILQVGEMIHRFVPEARLLDEGSTKTDATIVFRSIGSAHSLASLPAGTSNVAFTR